MSSSPRWPVYPLSPRIAARPPCLSLSRRWAAAAFLHEGRCHWSTSQIRCWSPHWGTLRSHRCCSQQPDRTNQILLPEPPPPLPSLSRHCVRWFRRALSPEAQEFRGQRASSSSPGLRFSLLPQQFPRWHRRSSSPRLRPGAFLWPASILLPHPYPASWYPKASSGSSALSAFPERRVQIRLRPPESHLQSTNL